MFNPSCEPYHYTQTVSRVTQILNKLLNFKACVIASFLLFLTLFYTQQETYAALGTLNREYMV